MLKGWTPVLALASLASVCAGPAEAKYKVIYSFCSQANCADGNGPNVGLISDAGGNLYGTAGSGGANGGGAVFELVKKKHGWSEKVLYSFCSQANCADGQVPDAPLIMDVSGNLYGVTFSRGAHSFGNVFELKKAGHGSWSLNVLYSFCSVNGCADGEGFPSGLSYFGRQNGAAYDGTSPLYGANSGAGGGGGLVYSLTPKGRKGWAFGIVYTFCAGGGPCPDGAAPLSSVLVESSSNILGTTGGGGSAQQGTVFKVTPNGSGWNESVLYSFCSQANCSDGSYPSGPLTIDGNGNLFGMTVYHGSTISRCTDGDDCGTIYEIAANGTQSTLYRFCTLANCADGTGPEGGVTIDASGKLYGTTLGVDGPGTLFSFDGALSVLHGFCSKDNCSDGSQPYDVTLISDASGDLFGTARAGGPFGGGVVFEWIP